jgi:hypothetical protein
MKERRRVQRYEFAEPPAALFGTHRVFLADVSIHGAAIHHDAAVSVGGVARLDASIGGERFSIECEVMSCRLQGHLAGHRYRSGLRFTASAGLAMIPVKNALIQLVSGQLDARRAQSSAVALSA